MVNREAGLQVLFERIKAQRGPLDIKTFRRNPPASVEEKDLMAVFMIEGRDRVVQRASRNWLGYPARRELEVFFELLNIPTFDIRSFYSQFRAVVLSSPDLVAGCSVREDQTFGPSNYGKPNIVGMQMMLLMTYVDNG